MNDLQKRFALFLIGCPSNSECMSTNPSMASFDTCGSRAYTCINSGH